MKIAVYGDSLTEGWPGAGFMPLLERDLPRHSLLNRGRAGDTTVDLLIDLLGRSAPRLILLPPVAPDGDLGEPFATRLAELAQIVERAAGSRPQARFVDLRPAFAADGGPFTIDGVHLNEAGAVVVAEALAAAIGREDGGAAT
ncbi:MAG: hypothetical protein JW767_11005 [Thermoleophilia bacterium]|nr:hypothetical protein [Thermoleophilia bacterium]